MRNARQERGTPIGAEAPGTPATRREGRLERALPGYRDADFSTGLKARFLFLLIAASLVLLAGVTANSALIHLRDPGDGYRLDWSVIGPELAGIAALAAILLVLRAGRFGLAAHLFLASAMACAWAVMFLQRSSPIVRLDSIVFPIALLGVTPFAVRRRKEAILGYAAANLGALWLFAATEGRAMGLAAADLQDFLVDSAAAMALAGIVAYSIHDITAQALEKARRELAEREAADEALLSLNAELESKVRERTAALSFANAELQRSNGELQRTLAELGAARDKMLAAEKLAALGRLSASIAHELNTPLAAIVSSNKAELACLDEGLGEFLAAAARLDPAALAFVDRARARIRGAPASFGADPKRALRERRKLAAALAAAGVADGEERAEDLIDLGLADLADEAIPFLRGPGEADFALVLRHALGALRAAAITEAAVGKAARAVAALRGYFGGVGPGQATAVALDESIAELVRVYHADLPERVAIGLRLPREAVAYGRKDELDRIWLNLIGNAVQAVGARGAVLVEARVEDREVLVSVVDDGPGIPEEIRHRIFEPFFTTKKAGEGTGLGLDIARRLARSNGGDISFESVPGRSEFRVRLPRASDPA